jgi:dual specificity tyrosine-phosphorylation-regulated kinase 2/3/4
VDEFGTPARPVGLRTPAKSTRALTTAHATPSTAPAARRQYLSTAGSENTASRRTSALVSDTLAASKTAASKLALPARRIAKSSTQASLVAAAAAEESDPPAASTISEEEKRADEEMAAYVRRQQAKRLASGSSAAELQRMFEFPAPSEPLSGLLAQGAPLCRALVLLV